jgi:hypothetical protein
MEQIIYLEIDDDILTVRDRLRRAQSKNVLLVVPAGCEALQRPLDLRLLRRQAAALDQNVALVSGNATLRDMAQEEGFTVFAGLSMGRRIARRTQQWRDADLPGKVGLHARLRQSQRPRWWRWLLGPLAFFLVLGALAAGVLTIWPSATVGVAPAREPIGVSVWVEADVSTRMVDWDRLRMPARVVQVEVVDRGEVETTGVTNVAAEHAEGQVLFVNLTRREIQISGDTIVSTSAGTPVRFRTLSAATVGPRSRVRVPIQALEGGPGSNVRAHMINRVEGVLASSLSVTNEGGTGGGTTDQVRRVTHGDKQQVSDLLIRKLIQKAYAEVNAELDGEYMPIETMWINQYSIRTNYDHHVNDKSDTLALEMRGLVGGVVVSEETAQEMARRALERQVRGGFHLIPDSVHISPGGITEVDADTGVVRVLMDGVALMEADIDAQLLQSAIRGRPADEALAYLRRSLPTEAEPTLEIRPEWMLRVPWLSFRISVDTGSDDGAQSDVGAASDARAVSDAVAWRRSRVVTQAGER